MKVRVFWPAVVGMVVVLSCTNLTDSCGCTPVPQPYGTWLATQFIVTPTGQAPIDVLAAGGSLTITITTSLTTTGTLTIPASVTGGSALTASMAGTATYNSAVAHVTFTQAADTFVRDLTWGYSGNTLTVSNQAAGGASYSMTLQLQ